MYRACSDHHPLTPQACHLTQQRYRAVRSNTCMQSIGVSSLHPAVGQYMTVLCEPVAHDT